MGELKSRPGSWGEYVLGFDKTSLKKTPLFNSDEKRDKNGDCYVLAGIYLNYEFQRDLAERFGGKILNAACADDPAMLGDLGAINLDVQKYEAHTKKHFDANKNFVHGSVFEIPFPDGEFDTVVLGEFLEHCVEERALAALNECNRVLKSGGKLIITVPLDGRTPNEQRDWEGGIYQPFEYVPGVTCHHQTWWSNQMISRIRARSRFVEALRCPLIYILTAPIGGWGLLWEKP